MKKAFLLMVLIGAISVIEVFGQNEKCDSIKSYSEFEAAMPPVRYTGNPIIKHGGWAGGQVQEPCILQNPKDSSKLIMFYAGADLVAQDGGKGAIGKAWAYKSSPCIWHQYKNNPILVPNMAILFENFSIRLDCVLYRADLDEYWIYFTGRTGSGDGEDAIGLATCPTGSDGYAQVTRNNIKLYVNNPILTATGQGRNDGKSVSQSTVIFDSGTYYMYYSYRGKEILPGIRYATSKNGKTWLKQGEGDILSRGVRGSADSRYFEWKHIFRAFNKFIIVWEAFSGKTWTVCMASSTSPQGPWVKSPKNPIFAPSGKARTFDKIFVATPAMYLIDNKWYLYYQGANQGGNYNYNTWDMGVAILDPCRAK